MSEGGTHHDGTPPLRIISREKARELTGVLHSSDFVPAFCPAGARWNGEIVEKDSVVWIALQTAGMEVD